MVLAHGGEISLHEMGELALLSLPVLLLLTVLVVVALRSRGPARGGPEHD